MTHLNLKDFENFSLMLNSALDNEIAFSNIKNLNLNLIYIKLLLKSITEENQKQFFINFLIEENIIKKIEPINFDLAEFTFKNIMEDRKKILENPDLDNIILTVTKKYFNL